MSLSLCTELEVNCEKVCDAVSKVMGCDVLFEQSVNGYHERIVTFVCERGGVKSDTPIRFLQGESIQTWSVAISTCHSFASQLVDANARELK